MDFLIKNVRIEDMETIQEIYAHYVMDTTFSFEEEPPTTDELENRRQAVQAENLPYIVAKSDRAEVLGYAYVLPYRPRSAYRFTAEHSVYVSPHYQGRGIGSALIKEIIHLMENSGYRQLIAVIGGEHNSASINLHQKFGFQRAAVLKSVGFKFNHWIDSLIMQRPLGEGDSSIPKIML